MHPNLVQTRLLLENRPHETSKQLAHFVGFQQKTYTSHRKNEDMLTLATIRRAPQLDTLEERGWPIFLWENQSVKSVSAPKLRISKEVHPRPHQRVCVCGIAFPATCASTPRMQNGGAKAFVHEPGQLPTQLWNPRRPGSTCPRL